eukprot:266837_1
MTTSTKHTFLVILCLIFSIFASTHTQLTNWRLQTSAKIGINGSDISTLSYDDKSWYNITVPSTTLNGLLQNNVYKDPYYSLNLQNINSSQFDVSWWYRTEFITNGNMMNTTVLLKLCGINYAANIWINGELVANNNTIIGTLVEFNIDITSFISTTDIFNAIAIEIFKPINGWTSSYKTSTDLAISYIDWNPTVPDLSMGIWKPVYLDIINIFPNLQLQYPLINASIDQSVATMKNTTMPTNANLTIMIEINNFESIEITDILTVYIENIGTISKQITLPANCIENKIFLSFEDHPILQLKNKAYLWWPYQFLPHDSKPYLYNISFQISNNIYNTTFGIRQIESELITKYKFLLFKINHKPILITGGGYATNLLYNFNKSYVRSEMEYIKHMGLNTIRLEGKWPKYFFYQLADEYGILIQPGFECCDSWQHWNYWTNNTLIIAKNSLRSQIKKLRIHSSVFSFFASSDQLPPKNIEQTYLDIFKSEYWPNPIIASAANDTSYITQQTGVKMSGPYVWEPPNYWLESTPDGPLLNGQGLGGAFGYLTEGGPGANPMSYESITATIPSSELWPINSYWNWHCGNQNGLFGNLNYFTPPLNARYGISSSVKEYTYKASVASYESHRAMYEAYARNKYKLSTGVINWMLQNGWPSNMWNLYDYYLNVNGGYFGTRKALKYKYGYHLMLSYNDNSVWLISNVYSTVNKYNGNSLIAKAFIRDIMNGGNIVNEHNMTINTNDISEDTSMNLFIIENNQHNLKLWLIQLVLIDEISGMEIDENIYWYSTKMDVLDWSASKFYVTPCSKYADFTGLSSLKSVDLNVDFNTSVVDRDNEEYYHTIINITNPSNIVAFMVQLRIVNKDNEMSIIAPIFWSENLVTIFPMKSKIINATYPVKVMNGSTPKVEFQSYNDL